MGRAPCCDKANVKKGPWSPEEDTKLRSYIEQHHGSCSNWIALPQKIGLKRCGKSCRLRWLNYLRPDIKHGGFSEEEDNLICNMYMSIGSRWSIIAAQLPGRTDNDIKNYWNTRLKKKLLGNKQRRKFFKQEPGNEKETKNIDTHHVQYTINQIAPEPPAVPVSIPYSYKNPQFPIGVLSAASEHELYSITGEHMYQNQVDGVEFLYDNRVFVGSENSWSEMSSSEPPNYEAAAAEFDHGLFGWCHGD